MVLIHYLRSLLEVSSHRLIVRGVHRIILGEKFSTCTGFPNSVIKNMRKNLIFREYIRNCGSAGGRTTGGSQLQEKKRTSRREGMSGNTKNETLEW